MALVWLITGASNGFGLLLALHALKAGHNVIAAMRNPERSVEAAKSIEAAGGKVFELDMTIPQSAMYEKARSAEALYGRIDVLVNNAGYSVLGSFESFSEKETTRLFQTNIFGPLYLAQAILPAMRSRRSGTVVNLSSIAGLDAQPTCSLYSASKFALEGMTEALAKEVEEFGVTVLIVEPGAFRTNFLAAMTVSERGLGDYKGSVVDTTLQRFQAADGKQAGDPAKAVARIYDVVVGQGEAGHLKGKILRLLLGKDALTRTEKKHGKLQNDLEIARDITCSTDLV